MGIHPSALKIEPIVRMWRRDLHAHPELGYEVTRTASFVARKLQEFGCDIVATGVGRAGVVAVINGKRTPTDGEGHTIAFRADMDALPIVECGTPEYRSKTIGHMHACGHDGHTAMLLGAAQCLTETRDFAGRLVLVFQPAEEGGAGGKAMIDDGLVERFAIEKFFALHNYPGLPIGSFATRAGSIMAASDRLDIVIEGKGGHAARPHTTVDPVVIGAQIICALQTIVSRNIDPWQSAVVSVCQFTSGNSRNVIPDRADLKGTVRSLDADVRARLKSRIREVALGVAALSGGQAIVTFEDGYPPTLNTRAEAMAAADAAEYVAGAGNVIRDFPPMLAGEDFSFMLQKRPGAMLFIGNGASQELHHSEYDFNDSLLPIGVSFWVKLAENLLRAP